jgi:hypothetical protein
MSLSSPKPLLSDEQDERPPSSSSSTSLQEQPSATSDSARQERLAALQRRLGNNATDNRTQPSNTPDAAQVPQPFDVNHDKRIEFRRLVDPGIVRPNSKEVVLRALRVNPIPCSFTSALNDIFSF